MILPQSTTGRVFISYSRKDTAFAQRLIDALMARGFEAYLDVKDIAPGEPWQERLAQLIRSADAVVFLVSPDSVRSEICVWETTEAKSQEKRILPVVHRRVEDEQIPEALSRLNFIFMDDAAAFEPQLDLLVSALRTDLVWVREHTRLAELARNWVTSGKRNNDLLRGPSIEKAEAWIASRPADAPMPTDIHRAFIASSRQLMTRNQRYSVTGAIGAAVVFGGVALFAFMQRNDAIAQRAEAENNLTTAGKAIETIVFEIIEDIGTQGGINIEKRKNITENTRKILHSVNIKNNHKINRVKGAILGLASEISLSQGNNDIALVEMTEALKIFEKNIEFSADKIIAKRDLSITLNKLSNIKQKIGDISGALRDQIQALEISKEIYMHSKDDDLTKFNYYSSFYGYIKNYQTNLPKKEIEKLIEEISQLSVEIFNSGKYKERSAVIFIQTLIIKANFNKKQNIYNDAYTELETALEHTLKYSEFYPNNISLIKLALEATIGLAEIDQKNNNLASLDKRVDVIFKGAPLLAAMDRDDKQLQIFSVNVLGNILSIYRSMHINNKKLATNLAIEIFSKLEQKNRLTTQELQQLERMKNFLKEI